MSSNEEGKEPMNAPAAPTGLSMASDNEQMIYIKNGGWDIIPESNGKPTKKPHRKHGSNYTPPKRRHRK